MNHPDFPPFMTDEMPLDAALEALEFIPSQMGYSRKWNDLKFVAGESIGCWFLMRDGFCTKREACPPHDVRIFSPIAPIELMATIYNLWAEVYAPQEPLDTFLLWGKEWIDLQRELKKLIPQPPVIWAEREFLRHCFNHIERQHDWIDNDYEIIFSQVPRQLLIKANNTEVYCPAHGYLLGETIVSAKDLYRRLPKRFIGNVVLLQYDKNKLFIDRRQIPARWIDENQDQSELSQQ